MGVDWYCVIEIFSDRTEDLDTISNNIKTKYKRGPYDSLYRINKHTLEYSFNQPRGQVNIESYNYQQIIEDFPNCFIHGYWAGDCSTAGDFVIYYEDKVVFKELIYVGESRLFWQYGDHGQISSRLEQLVKTDVGKQNYCMGIQITGRHPVVIVRTLQKAIPLFHKYVKSQKYFENELELVMVAPELIQDALYKVLHIVGGCIFVRWHTEDGKRSGLWTGANDFNGLYVNSYEYPTNPLVYSKWATGRDKELYCCLIGH